MMTFLTFVPVLVLAQSPAADAAPPFRTSVPVAPPPPPPPPRPGEDQFARPPRITNAAQVVGVDDYPAAAWRAGRQGRVRYAVDVTKKGLPTGCTILTSSGDPELDATTCRLVVTRGKFVPGNDRRGKQVAGRATGIIFWRLPAEAPPLKPDGSP